MKIYFQTFDELIKLLEDSLDDSSGLDQMKLDHLLNKMNKLVDEEPKLHIQKQSVDFYGRTIRSLFSQGLSGSYKLSFYNQLKREKEILHGFAVSCGFV